LSEVPADKRRDSETLEQLFSIAESIFNRYGVDFTTAVRGCGWSNATWLAGGLALRMAVEKGTNHLRREAHLGALLPVDVGFPASIETGVTNGFEWSLSRQIRGKNLGDIYPGLEWDQRIDVMRQLWKKVEAVHTVRPDAADPFVRKRWLFYPADVAEARAGLARVVAQGIVSAHLAGLLEKASERFWEGRDQAPLVLNHGDFTTENALYHEGQVVSLLDFEYALIAPPELDVNELLKTAFLAPEHLDPLPDPGGKGLAQYQQAVIDMALPMLAHPGSKDLLLGYAVMLGIWMIENELAHPDENSPRYIERFTEELVSLCNGQGGYLAPILARIDP